MALTITGCLECGRIFLVEIKELNRGNGKFCDLTCAALHNNSNRYPNNSSSTAHRVARDLWIKRHDGKIPICWCGETADIHHIDGNMFNNNPNNHKPLCRSHHVSLENEKRKSM